MELRQTRHDERIKVDKQIVNLLSLATYESFPRVLRELISNSYDADATKVSIGIHLATNEIQVLDNGNGMNPDQFHYFLTIAGTARTALKSPRYKRERIGQFGVGFLASFPFCQELVVETTAADSTTVITATIPCARFFEERKTGPERGLEPVDQIPVPILETQDPRKQQDHYTRILLKGLTPLALQYFERNPSLALKRSVRDWPSMERLKWDLQDTIILDYPETSKIAKALNQQPVGMQVFLNETRLFRNDPPGEILETKVIEVNGVTARYIITSPWEPVFPVEMRGLRVRVNNVGVGRRETYGLAVQSGAIARLYWLSGDVYIDRGAREFLALNREGFTNAPAVEQLNEYLRFALRRVDSFLSKTDGMLKEVEAGLGMQVRGGGPRPRPRVGSKKELVARRIDQLEKTGFKVERIMSAIETDDTYTTTKETTDKVDSKSQKTRLKLFSEPIEIDRQSRSIRIYEDHPDFKDVMHTSLGEFALKFDSWNYATSDFPACSPVDARTMKINESYPLFRNRTFGQLFLRLAIIMTAMSSKSPAGKNFMKQLLLKWVDEFGNITEG